MRRSVIQKCIHSVIEFKGDHVVVSERAIRVIKGSIRCLLSEMNWKLPSWTEYLVYYVCNRINSLPRLTSRSHFIPRERFRGIKLSYKST